LKYEDAQRMVDQLKESNEDLATELEQAKEKLEQIAHSEELQSLVRDLESQLAEVRLQLQRKDGEKMELESQLNNMTEELRRADDNSSDYLRRPDELQTELDLHQDNEAMLGDQLKQAKDDATQLQRLWSQHSAEIEVIDIQSEEVRNQISRTATPLGHSKAVADQDNSPTESNEIGRPELYISVCSTAFFLRDPSR